MKFLEKDLEEIIQTTDRETLKEKGLHINGVMKRQLRIGHYGVADLVTFHRDYDYIYDPSHTDKGVFYSTSYQEPKLVVTVYELKKEKISVSAFMQCVKYARGLRCWFDNRDVDYSVDINIVLIGKDLDLNGSTCFLPSVLGEKVEFYTYYMDIEGLHFKNESRYLLTHNGF